VAWREVDAVLFLRRGVGRCRCRRPPSPNPELSLLPRPAARSGGGGGGGGRRRAACPEVYFCPEGPPPPPPQTLWLNKPELLTEPDAEVAKRPGLDTAFKALPWHMDSRSMRICGGGPNPKEGDISSLPAGRGEPSAGRLLGYLNGMVAVLAVLAMRVGLHHVWRGALAGGPGGQATHRRGAPPGGPRGGACGRPPGGGAGHRVRGGARGRPLARVQYVSVEEGRVHGAAGGRAVPRVRHVQSARRTHRMG
jgi:hypothetical protein